MVTELFKYKYLALSEYLMSTKGGEQKIEIKKTIVIDASPEVVFKAITDPEELTNWFPDQAILEPGTGGKMKFSFTKKIPRNMTWTIFQKGLFWNLLQTKKSHIHGNIQTHTRLSKNSCNMGA
jgi:hypothetical protein